MSVYEWNQYIFVALWFMKDSFLLQNFSILHVVSKSVNRKLPFRYGCWILVVTREQSLGEASVCSCQFAGCNNNTGRLWFPLFFKKVYFCEKPKQLTATVKLVLGSLLVKDDRGETDFLNSGVKLQDGVDPTWMWLCFLLCFPSWWPLAQ